MDGSLYSCEMPFDPDQASVCHASTAAVSIHCVYIHIDERGFLVAQQKWTCPFHEVCFVLFFSSLFSSVMRDNIAHAAVRGSIDG